MHEILPDPSNRRHGDIEEITMPAQRFSPVRNIQPTDSVTYVQYIFTAVLVVKNKVVLLCTIHKFKNF